MENELKKQIKFLKIYSFILTVVVLTIGLLGCVNDCKHSRFKEIDVERINIVEKTGKLTMVISNRELQHPGIANGKVLPKRERSPGMIFFNTDGDECGGLIYDGTKKEAGFVLSVDKYRNDQLMQLQYNQESAAGKVAASYGLKLWDRPDHFSAGQLLAIYDSLKSLKNDQILKAGIEKLRKQGLIGQDRMFVGKNQLNQYGIFIKDGDGHPRINLYVNEHNKVVMQALDQNGQLIPFN